MKKLYINGKEVSTKKEYLKDVLTEQGMLFPCDGKGLCGKCRISCSELLPTSLDKKFLSANQITEGLRLACDKKTIDNINIKFTKNIESATHEKLDFCNIAVIIDAHSMNLGILNDNLIEQKYIPLNTRDFTSIKLRSFIAKECIELFEKYSVAKADTIAVAANQKICETLLGEAVESGGDTLDADDYMLPAESLYILPFINKDIGGDFLCLAINKSRPRLIIKADNQFVLGLLMDDEFLCVYHKGVTYSENELIALKASIKLILKNIERPPVISIYGVFSDKVATILEEYTYAEENDSSLEIVGRTCDENNLKNKLYKLQKSVSIFDPVQDDEWHKQFILSANN